MIGNWWNLKRALRNIASALDRALLNILLRSSPKKSKDARGVVCICLEGTGNLGSRALLESAIYNLPKETIFVGANSELFQEVGMSPNRFETISKIYPSLSWKHLKSLVKLSTILGNAQSVFVVSADNIDGAWSDMLSSALWNAAIVASDNGRQATMFGASWNRNPSKSATKSLIRASKSGVRILARDSDSYMRMLLVATDNVSKAADIVFATKTIYEDDRVHKLDAEAPEVSVLCGNPGFTLGKNLYPVESLRPLLKELSSSGKIILVASVVRQGQNDLEQLRRIYDHFKKDFELELIETFPQPLAMRELVAKSKLLVTFRMHPAIIALSERVPVVMFDYQDKMAGLAKDLGVAEFCVSNSDWVNSGSKAIKNILEHRAEMVKALQNSLPAQIKSAKLNFEVGSRGKI